MSDHVSPHFLWMSLGVATSVIVLAVFRALIGGCQKTGTVPLIFLGLGFLVMYLYSRHIYKTETQPNRVEKLKEKMEE